MKKRLLFILLTILTVSSCREKVGTVDYCSYVTYTVQNNLDSQIELRFELDGKKYAIFLDANEGYTYVYELQTGLAYNNKLALFSSDKIEIILAGGESYIAYYPTQYLSQTEIAYTSSTESHPIEYLLLINDAFLNTLK